MATLTAKEALKTFFGYDTFRPLQEDVIQSVSGGKDCLVLMPTGGGKSICYQLPALMKPGMAVVVSPLIALMRDQVLALQANGVSAAFLNSSQTQAEQHEVIEKALVADLKLLYISPEKALSPDLFSLLTRVKLNLIAIDEAHVSPLGGMTFGQSTPSSPTCVSDLRGCHSWRNSYCRQATRLDIAQQLQL